MTSLFSKRDRRNPSFLINRSIGKGRLQSIQHHPWPMVVLVCWGTRFCKSLRLYSSSFEKNADPPKPLISPKQANMCFFWCLQRPSPLWRGRRARRRPFGSPRHVLQGGSVKPDDNRAPPPWKAPIPNCPPRDKRRWRRLLASRRFFCDCQPGSVNIDEESDGCHSRTVLA